MIKTAEPANKPADTESAEQEQDDFLEESLEETFSASDPIAPGHTSREPSKDASSR
jgi:hypothetical protein